jgi:hypothetical protein
LISRLRILARSEGFSRKEGFAKNSRLKGVSTEDIRLPVWSLALEMVEVDVVELGSQP